MTVPFLCIDQVSKVGRQYSRGDHSYCIEVACKDLRILLFSFIPYNHPRREVFSYLVNFSLPATMEDTFAFTYYQALKAKEIEQNQQQQQQQQQQQAETPTGQANSDAFSPTLEDSHG